MFSSKEYRAMARNKLSGHWLISVLVTFVAGLLGGVSGSGGSFGGGFASGFSSGASGQGAGSAELESAMQEISSIFDANPAILGVILSILGVVTLISLALFVIGGAVELGHNAYYIDLCNNTEPAFDVLFSRFRIFLKALGLRLYMALFIFLWSLLFIIPGIIAAYRYAMAPFIMAQDPNVGIREAVNRSKDMMQGRKWKLFCLGFSFIGWALLCVLTFGIGFLWLSPYQMAATAAFYLDVSGQGIPLDRQSIA